MTRSEMALLFGGVVGQNEKNILQMACAKLGSSDVANSAFWHEWSVSGYSNVEIGYSSVKFDQNITDFC